jgi:predicted transcriptional regulator
LRVRGLAYRLLAFLREPRTSRDIWDWVEETGVSMHMVRLVVPRLVKAGLVYRESLPVSYGRGLYLYRLTEAGTRVLDCLDTLKNVRGLVVTVGWGEE